MKTIITRTVSHRAATVTVTTFTGKGRAVGAATYSCRAGLGGSREELEAWTRHVARQMAEDSVWPSVVEPVEYIG